ncbi:hypothetical protein SFC15_22270 [Shouchella clausii]
MPKQEERIKRCKENQKLVMENDILKRADQHSHGLYQRMDAWSDRNAVMDEPIKIYQLLEAAIAYVLALFAIIGLEALFVGVFPRATIGLKI